MEIKRTIEIFVETNRMFVIHQPQSAEQIFCPRCTGPMLTAEQSAALFKVSPRDIYRLIENDKVHFTETEAAAMFVCPPSLDRAIGDANDAPPAEIVKLLANSAAENQTGEIEIQGELL